MVKTVNLKLDCDEITRAITEFACREFPDLSDYYNMVVNIDADIEGVFESERVVIHGASVSCQKNYSKQDG